MPPEDHADALSGPARSELWDVALGQLARHSSVELDAVVSALDDRLDGDEVCEAAVRDALEDGLVRRNWLREHDRLRDVWLPDYRAFALLDLTVRGAGSAGVATAPTLADTVARTVA